MWKNIIRGTGRREKYWDLIAVEWRLGPMQSQDKDDFWEFEENEAQSSNLTYLISFFIFFCNFKQEMWININFKKKLLKFN